MIEVYGPGNLDITVTETTKDDQGKPVSSRTEIFRTRWQTMRQSSTRWAEMFDPDGPWRDGGGTDTTADFGEVPMFSFEILLRAVHDNPRGSQAHDASILNVW